MENNKKVDIKSLLEENNLKINNNKVEDNIDKVLGQKPEGFSVENVENANPELGQAMKEEEIMKRAGIRGGGTPGNLISAEQMASIEETIR
jgi:hypothetical protein